MYKLVEPFENGKIYNYNKKDAIKEIFKDLKQLNTINVKIKIQDIRNGNEHNYFIIDKKNHYKVNF